jgi:hypothetical protein
MNTLKTLTLLGLLAALAALSACPRQQPEAEAPVNAGAETAATETTETADAPAAGDFALPLDYLEPAGGMTEAPLPADLLDDYADGQVNEGSTRLHVRFEDQGMDYWYVGLTSAAGPRDLLNYYNGIMTAKGFEPDADNAKAAESDGGAFQLMYAMPDGSHAVRIYPADPAATNAGEETAYVLFLQQRAPTDAAQ